ncbi:hypothetical protein, partial [Rhizobium leguminosarum]|uniref:hypothetical protein n=1 Tax=Rhizobium leguminosarum TaxID=384 RepID=UPI003F9AD86F
QAHNLKAAGSNPAPATKPSHKNNTQKARLVRAFCVPEVGIQDSVIGKRCLPCTLTAKLYAVSKDCRYDLTG